MLTCLKLEDLEVGPIRLFNSQFASETSEVNLGKFRVAKHDYLT